MRLHALDEGGLLATDVSGRLHQFDDDLALVRSSPVVSAGMAAYSLAVSGRVAVSKDRLGNVTRWDLENLRPTHLLTAKELRVGEDYLEDEDPSPVINRGVAIWRDRVYVNNGYLQVVILDLATFAVLDASAVFRDVFLEWICLDRPGQQAVSDKSGRLFLGDLEAMKFPLVVRVDDDSNVHRVVWDPVHERYWAIQDAGNAENVRVSNGVVTVLPDGTIEDRLLFAADDIECLAFSADFSKAYVGGFDAELHVFDNTTRELRIAQTFRDFSHEIIDLVVLQDGTVAVLSQDGQISRRAPNGTRLDAPCFARQCVWDIRAVAGQPDVYRLGTDSGVQTIRVDEDAVGPNPVVIAHWRTGNGFVRSIATLNDHTFGVSHGREVFRLDGEGHVVWCHKYSSRLHTVAVNPDGDRVLVASNEGAVEHDAATGARLRSLNVDRQHVWVSGYLLTGEPVAATHNFEVMIFDKSGERLWSVKCDGYAKRMRATDEYLYVTGGGGLRKISLGEREVVQAWTELLDNTVENFAFHEDFVYAISYGCQIGVYSACDSAGLGLIEMLPDFPKGLVLHRAADGGSTHMLVGGRGGYLEVRRLDENGEPALVRTTYLEP